MKKVNKKEAGGPFRKFSKFHLAAVTLVFAAIGAYTIWQTQAAVDTSVGANIFISATGSDSGSNCVRFSTKQSTAPSAATVCKTAARAYNLAQFGDTVWVLPGNYSSGLLDFDSANVAVSKNLGSNDCNATDQCIYITPQPGQENNVITGSIGFKATYAPNHLYYKNFQRGSCPALGPLNYTSTTGFAKDITFDNFKAVSGDNACTPWIAGPWSYIRIINSEFSYNCTSGSAGGFPIQSNQSGMGGEADNHIWVPDHITLDNNYFHDYVVNGCTGGHQDCIHIYAWTNSKVSNSVFNNCYDSSILAEGLDENGYAENNIIENNWFGPTVLGVNNCCFRGDSVPSNETFDNWIVRYNSSVDTFMNKSGLVLNNVSFIGNIGLGGIICKPGTNVVYAYNFMGSGACGGTDTGGVNNSLIRFINTSGANLNLRLQSGSAAIDKVPPGQGYPAVDIDGNARLFGFAVDAGAHEFGSTGGPPATTKTGDLNSDNNVNIFDLSILLSNYNKTPAQSSNPKCDINSDGNINIFDLSILLSNYGK